jgi:hypothetical protein
LKKEATTAGVTDIYEKPMQLADLQQLIFQQT